MLQIINGTKKDRKRSGFIMMTYCIMLVFTLAMVGLAVDAGTLYVIKGRLSSAVDAAALAAGRSVNLGSTPSLAQTAATSTATQYFNANFPSGFLGTGTPTVTPTFTDGSGTSDWDSDHRDLRVRHAFCRAYKKGTCARQLSASPLAFAFMPKSRRFDLMFLPPGNGMRRPVYYRSL
ncbi:MAG: pilus assembly protein TadG-related protein [Bryobacteraceae bacterium]